MNKAITRFAPSPTGYLHVGTVRTALFAWLIAKQSDGSFILRIEDTDKNREISGGIEHIQKSLKWLNLNWNEGPGVGGPNEPYLQSERLKTYHEWAQKLIKQGRAYADPYTPQEVQAFREQAIKNKTPFLYRNHRPEAPPKWDGSQPLRFKSEPTNYKWNDIIMGELSTGPEVIDDFILIKSDGYPTYNFAHIIDDMLMNITHIIRGPEFLASMPNYLNLYAALSLPVPLFATVPHVMAPTGNKKLSKRDSAKDILEYKKMGFLPEAMINMLVSLGWNDGTEEEIYTINQLIESFEISKVQKSGARFDEQKLLWINGAHIRKLSLDKLKQYAENYWPQSAQTASEEYKNKVLTLIQERLKYFAELPELTHFFFETPSLSADQPFYQIAKNKKLKKAEPATALLLLEGTCKKLQDSTFTVNDLQTQCYKMAEKHEVKPGIYFELIRIAITGSIVAPGLFETMHVLGKKTCLKRLESAAQSLQNLL